MLDPWYVENLRCPVERTPLRLDGNYLVSSSGRRYPIANGIPVMLVEERPQTIGIAKASIELSKKLAEGGQDEYCVDSLGVTPHEQEDIRRLIAANGLSEPDPVASFLVGATNGIAYEGLIGKLKDYPIPDIAIPVGDGKSLLDIGCNWGRWCMASARKGYKPVGIDPSLGAVLAARRISKSQGLDCRFVVGDARWLPFADELFDQVWSFSVIQHFSKPDAATSLSEVQRVLKSGGRSDIQMPTTYGVRCLWHQFRRGFREPESFDVRYYTLPELKRLFENRIGKSLLDVHCYLGIGLLTSDYQYMSSTGKAAIVVSEIARKASRFVPPLKYLADSIYVRSTKS